MVHVKPEDLTWDNNDIGPWDSASQVPSRGDSPQPARVTRDEPEGGKRGGSHGRAGLSQKPVLWFCFQFLGPLLCFLELFSSFPAPFSGFCFSVLFELPAKLFLFLGLSGELSGTRANSSGLMDSGDEIISYPAAVRPRRAGGLPGGL